MSFGESNEPLAQRSWRFSAKKKSSPQLKPNNMKTQRPIFVEHVCDVRQALNQFGEHAASE
ncbi:MAG: hypothetical protein WBQ20_06315 [Methyloceanibacter sp.]